MFASRADSCPSSSVAACSQEWKCAVLHWEAFGTAVSGCHWAADVAAPVVLVAETLVAEADEYSLERHLHRACSSGDRLGLDFADPLTFENTLRNCTKLEYAFQG